ncbi:MAG: hypothetical protein WKF87_06230 [Chryseolinea sp.]
MKTTKQESSPRTSVKQKFGPSSRSKIRHSIEARDLNGANGQRTNIDIDSERDVPVENTSALSDTSVEDEQDREVKRRLEDAHPDEVLNGNMM